jgi:hypothetical protein
MHRTLHPGFVAVKPGARLSRGVAVENQLIVYAENDIRQRAFGKGKRWA